MFSSRLIYLSPLSCNWCTKHHSKCFSPAKYSVDNRSLHCVVNQSILPVYKNHFNQEFLTVFPHFACPIKKYCHDLEQKCWKCCQPQGTVDFYCISCGAIQQPDERKTYFALLNVPVKYDIDIDLLSSRFRKMQMIFHPDRFVNTDEKELMISEKYSRLFNKAYSTLKNPLTRGLYILELNKCPVPKVDHGIESEFLEDVMEKNEEIESAKDLIALEKISKEVDQKLKDFEKVIKYAFNNNDYSTAKAALLRMQYFAKMDEVIKEKKLNFLDS